VAAKKTEKYAISFFNNVQDFAEIVEQIKDDQKFGKPSKRAYGISKNLAQKILKARERLPGKKFQSLDQLDSIRGIGKDTMHDIINTFETNSEPNRQPVSSEFKKIFFDEFVRTLAQNRAQDISSGTAAEITIEANYRSKADEVDEEFQVECGDKSKIVKFYGRTNGNAHSSNHFREWYMHSPTGNDKYNFLDSANNEAIARAKAKDDPKKFRCKGKCKKGDCADFPALKIIEPGVIDRADSWPSVGAIWPFYFLYTHVIAHVDVKVQCPCME